MKRACLYQSQYDEDAFKQSFQAELIDLAHDWAPQYTWRQFLTYQATSLFRPATVLYLHPLSLFQEQRRADWRDVDCDDHDAFLAKHGLQVIVMMSHPETFRGSWTVESVPTVALRSLRTNISAEDYAAQWFNLSTDHKVVLFMAYPALLTASALTTWFESASFGRQLIAAWLPHVQHWKAKDFLLRDAFHRAAQAATDLVSNDLFLVTKAVQVWSEQRRHLLISFDWFYEHAIRPAVRPEACKTAWLQRWRLRSAWTNEELARYVDPERLLGQVVTPTTELALAHDPIWKYARHTWPRDLAMTRESWFSYLRRL